MLLLSARYHIYPEPQPMAQEGQQENGTAGGGEDEDADPLDAFMTGLHAPTVAQVRHASLSLGLHSRFGNRLLEIRGRCVFLCSAVLKGCREREMLLAGVRY